MGYREFQNLSQCHCINPDLGLNIMCLVWKDTSLNSIFEKKMKIHVTPWLIHVNVWQNPLQCYEVISLQLIKINEKKKENITITYKRAKLQNAPCILKNKVAFQINVCFINLVNKI